MICRLLILNVLSILLSKVHQNIQTEGTQAGGMLGMPNEADAMLGENDQ